MGVSVRVQATEMPSLFSCLTTFGECSIWIPTLSHVVMLLLGMGSLCHATVMASFLLHVVIVVLGVRDDSANVAGFLGCFAALNEGSISVTAIMRDFMMVALMSDDSALVTSSLGLFTAFGEGTISVASFMSCAGLVFVSSGERN